MRFGNFSLLISEGRERDSGHVEMEHCKQYTLRLSNNDWRRCDAVVNVDGKEVGCFRINGHDTITLERPAHDAGRFTFFKAGSIESANAGEASVENARRGLIKVTFNPEKPPVQHVYRDAGLGTPLVAVQCSHGGGAQPRSFTESDCCVKTSGMAAGITGLTGHSDQQFVTVASIDYDMLNAVTISVRLTCVESGVSPLTAAAAQRGNPVPAAVA